MRRLRGCLASIRPGRLGSPSAPTTRGCLQWLDAGRMKGGESRPDQAQAFRPRKHGPEREKPPQRSAVRRAGHAWPAPRLHTRERFRCVSRRSAPSDLVFAGSKQKDDAPASLKTGGWSLRFSSPLPLAGEVATRSVAGGGLATSTAQVSPPPQPSPASGRGRRKRRCLKIESEERAPRALFHLSAQVGPATCADSANPGKPGLWGRSTSKASREGE